MINGINYNSMQYEISRKTDLYSAAGRDPKSVSNISPGGDEAQRVQKMPGSEECKTCRERRYQDGSNDPGVSFKSPTRVSPEAAGAAVASHENEHVTREQSRAREEDREIINQSVQLYTSTCPECGKIYISGGKTTTTTAKNPPPKNYEPGLILDKYV